MATVRTLPIRVYRNVGLGDCTNGGISSKYDELYLVCEDGWKDVDENDERLVKIVGTIHCKHIEPCKHCPEGHIGWMNGGNIANSCDGRFYERSAYPLEIFDRCETTEEYRALSI